MFRSLLEQRNDRKIRVEDERRKYEKKKVCANVAV